MDDSLKKIRSLFVNINNIFPRTPVRHQDPATILATPTPQQNAPDSAIGTQQPPEPTETSNDSFDMAAFFNNPKAAALLMQRSRAADKQGKLVYTYHGSIGLFDEQSSFRREIPHWTDMYVLDIGPNGKRSDINRKSVREHVSQYCDAIQFRVFCAEFARAYVGSSEENEHATALAIADCGKRLEKIKMRYYDRAKKHMVTTTPDTAFKLMISHVGLLPENATDWPFCLPWLFFQALPDNLQEEMRRDKYTLPKPAELVISKSQQLKKLLEVRDKAKNSYDKLKDLKLTVDRAIFMTSDNSTAYSSTRGSNVKFEDSTLNTMDHAFYNEDENFQPIQNRPPAAQPSVTFQSLIAQVHNYGPQLSRAKETIQNELRKKCVMQFCHPDFVQKFHSTPDGAKYPYRPTGNGFSKQDVNFRGFFACGSVSHRFGDQCPNNSAEGRRIFNFELHCHKPSFFFKHHRTQEYTHSQGNNSPSSAPTTGMGRGRSATAPAWQTRQNRSDRDNSNAPYSRTGDRSASQYVIQLRIHTM